MTTYETLPRLVRAMAETDPERLYLQTVEGEELSYAASHARNLRWAALYEELGVKAGDTVCQMLPNTPAFIQSWMGIAWLGAIEVPLNTGYRGNLLVHTLEDSRAEVLCISVRFLDQLREVAGGLTRLRTVFVPDITEASQAGELPFDVVPGPALELAKDRPVNLHEPRAHDLASILYTSGTTGPSKGVMVSWAQLEETTNWVLPWEPNEVCYSALPLYHVAGKAYGAYLPALSGGRGVLRESFKTREFWSDIRRFGCTMTGMVGTIPTFLMREPERPDDADNPLQRVVMVPLIPEVEQMKKRFGIKVHTEFNMTETSIPLCSDPYVLANERSVGKVREGYQARIVDDLDNEVPVNVAGELVLRSDNPWLLMQGYWQRPDATVEAWRNLWFHTGDSFYRDEEGNFYFVDRKKDSIRRRGENVSSFEIEREVDCHPAVLECAAVGVPSEFGEDEIKVFVVLKPGKSLEAAELYEHLVPRLAKFMMPRFISIKESLPKTPTHKIRKVELRAETSDPVEWDALQTS